MPMACCVTSEGVLHGSFELENGTSYSIRCDYWGLPRFDKVCLQRIHFVGYGTSNRRLLIA